MSEKEETIIRGQAILMIARNVGKEKVTKRILKRFFKCINGGVSEKKEPNKARP
tara:strand:+ start:595 stop:756 length:162 start_codon:yes stop_codon:yes gene_type:complete